MGMTDPKSNERIDPWMHPIEVHESGRDTFDDALQQHACANAVAHPMVEPLLLLP